jgi:hypothetical protein
VVPSDGGQCSVASCGLYRLGHLRRILHTGRPRLATLHVAMLAYGVIIEIFGFWCPLTAFETWLEVRGGVSAYRGPFLLHYVDAVVYPNIPPNLLIAGAVAVCVLNLWIYARRVRVRHSLG